MQASLGWSQSLCRIPNLFASLSSLLLLSGILELETKSQVTLPGFSLMHLLTRLPSAPETSLRETQRCTPSGPNLPFPWKIRETSWTFRALFVRFPLISAGNEVENSNVHKGHIFSMGAYARENTLKIFIFSQRTGRAI